MGNNLHKYRYSTPLPFASNAAIVDDRDNIGGAGYDIADHEETGDKQIWKVKRPCQLSGALTPQRVAMGIGAARIVNMKLDESVPAVVCTKLAKSYDGVPALRGIDLRVEQGEIFGFLGPNGAGKTTAIRCMLDLIRPTEGTIRILTIDPQADPVAVKQRTGYLPGELSFDDNLTARQLLRLLDSLRASRGDWKYVDSLCQRLHLETDRSIKNLSKGNKQKVGIIQAFMHRPQLLLLDEPTGGLDPIMQQEVLKLIVEARDAGATVFLFSHMLSEVQSVADRIAVVREGLIAVAANTSAILQRQLRRVVVVFRDPCPASMLSEVPGVQILHNHQQREYHLQIAGDMDALIKALAPYYIQDIRAEQATLEDVFLTYFHSNSAG